MWKSIRPVMFVWFKARPLGFSCPWVSGGCSHGMIREHPHNSVRSAQVTYRALQEQHTSSLQTLFIDFSSFLPTPPLQLQAPFPIPVHYLRRSGAANPLKAFQKAGNTTLHCSLSTYKICMFRHLLTSAAFKPATQKWFGASVSGCNSAL